MESRHSRRAFIENVEISIHIIPLALKLLTIALLSSYRQSTFVYIIHSLIFIDPLILGLVKCYELIKFLI